MYEAHYSDENRSDEDDEFETETPVTTIEATTTETESMELATDETTLEQTVLKNADDEKEKSFEVYTKQIVKHRGGSWVRNTEPLPEGWILINHHAGFPLYFHRESRVVTWSRPYCVGSSSVKAHKIPVTAIPCLAYTKRTVNVPTEEENNEEDKPDEENGLPSVDAQLVKSEIETIDSQALKDYLAKRFDFSEVTCKRYQSHEAYGDAIQRRKDARKRHREKKKELRDNNSRGDEEDDQDLPTIAKKFIEVKIPDKKGTGKKVVTIHLSGKATVSVLNEYCSRALKCGPLYEQIENGANIQKDHKTYQVKLPDGKVYGCGSGPNQQAAKNVAALEALQQLIKDFQPDDKNMLTGRAQADIAYFNHVKITDSRIHQFSQQVGLTPPYQFFMEIQHKHQGPQQHDNLDIQVFQDETKGAGAAHWKFTFQGIELEGQAKSKKVAKHIAAQHMFAKLNPDLATWGDVLNKYQHVTQRKEAKEKTNDEESITQLFKGKSGPKTALLAKLRDMMRRVANEQQHFLNGADHISPLFTEMRGETGTSILP